MGDVLAAQLEDLSSDPRDPREKAGRAACICNLSDGEWGVDGQMQEAP